MKAYLLVDAIQEGISEVGTWLQTCAEVRAVRRVRYGHFHWFAELDAPNHMAVQLFIANKVRYHRGVEQVREVDEGDIPAILASAVPVS